MYPYVLHMINDLNYCLDDIKDGYFAKHNNSLTICSSNSILSSLGIQFLKSFTGLNKK